MPRPSHAIPLATALLLALPARAGDLREVPVDLSLVPPISLNGDGPAVNHVSLGLAVARSTVLRGVALAPVHVADEDVTGVQLTWAAATSGGTVRGLQLTTVANVARDLRGAQLAQAVNVARGEARGLQLGGAVNWAGRLAGAQLGYGLNRATELSGAQVAILNAARTVDGLQLAVVNAAGALDGAQVAVVNAAGAIDGLQLAVVNVGGDVGGAQVGVVNVARRVHGMQLGVVNVSDEADGALGVLSLVRQGRHDVEVYGTEVSPLSVAARLGGRRVHGLLAAGVKPGASAPGGGTRWTTGGGAGVGFEPAERLAIDVDALAQTIHDGGREADAGVFSLRVLGAWRASEWIALFGGPTVNVLVSRDERPDLDLGWRVSSGARDVRVWVGVAAGLRM